MKKYMFLILMLVMIAALLFTACASRIQSQEVYGFPEPTSEISIEHYAAGRETTYIFTQDTDMLQIMQWFYDLKLKEMKQKPEAVEGNQFYAVAVDEEHAFTYDDRGGEAYLYINERIFEVANPSNPPME